MPAFLYLPKISTTPKNYDIVIFRRSIFNIFMILSTINLCIPCIALFSRICRRRCDAVEEQKIISLFPLYTFSS